MTKMLTKKGNEAHAQWEVWGTYTDAETAQMKREMKLASYLGLMVRLVRA